MDTVQEVRLSLSYLKCQRRALFAAMVAWRRVASRDARDRRNEFELDFLWLRRRYGFTDTLAGLPTWSMSISKERLAEFHRELATLLEDHRVTLRVTYPSAVQQ